MDVWLYIEKWVERKMATQEERNDAKWLALGKKPSIVIFLTHNLHFLDCLWELLMNVN